MRPRAFFADARDFSWGIWSRNDREWLDTIMRRWVKRCSEKESGESGESLIPKSIHQIWVGPQQIPECCFEYMESWKTTNPSFQYNLWRDTDIANLSADAEAILDLPVNPAQKSDIIRLLILRKYGGVYVDVDFECIKAFDHLLLGKRFFVGFSNCGCVEINNALIACVAEDPLICYLTSLIGHSMQASGKIAGMPHRARFRIEEMLGESLAIDGYLKSERNFLATTGPGFLTRAMLTWIMEERDDEAEKGNWADIVVYPPRYFYPVPNSHRSVSESIKLQFVDNVDTHAIHHWKKTWDTCNNLK